ncbi:hypothetical protein [Ramlibacter algicola]|uniref:Uncharacterized protein n=1 Tax=Ramlibacter algicola TaxID=2795217 RepID=A0A934PVC4_9BURK|nr:hypothetical protein [Ramlibacter algicola]MBK0391144.1 hypothetical protein [Ramlibacter algicola]
MKNAHWIAPALLAVGLAGCGGGGGGGDGGATAGGGGTVSAPAPAPAVVITQANAPTVGAHGLDAAQDDSSTNTAGILTGVQVQGGADVGPLALAAIARRMGGKVTALPLASGVQVDETQPCQNGGSVRIVGTVASNSALGAGDDLTITATNCAEPVNGVMTTLNGQMRFEITAGSMPGSGVPPFHVVLRVTTTALSVQTSTDLATSDGDMTIDLTMTSSTAQTLVVSGTSLSSSATINGVQRRRTLANYSQRVVLNGSTVTGAVSGTVTTDSTRLGPAGGTFTLSTPQDLRWSTTSDAPVAGQLKVTGAGNSAVRLTFGASSVTVETDANGDGTYEGSTTATVAQLQGLL